MDVGLAAVSRILNKMSFATDQRLFYSMDADYTDYPGDSADEGKYAALL